MGYAAPTTTRRPIERHRFGTRDVLAREPCADRGDGLFEPVNLADDSADAARVREPGTLLPPPAAREVAK